MDEAPGLLELEVGSPAAGGGFVARAPDGRVVFVRHALPGELVRVVVTAETARYLRADAVEVVRPSPERVAPPCPYAGPGACGGCDYQHADPAAQRAYKSSLVAEQLRRVAGVEREVEVEELPGAPDGLGWRTRLRFAVDGDGRLGLRRHRSHDLVVVDGCLLATEAVETVGAEASWWPGAHEVEVFAPALSAPRVVSVRTDGSDAFEPPQLDSGLVVDGRTVVRPPRLHLEVNGRSYRVSAGSFWQVHAAAPELLVTAVLQGLRPEAGERVLDLYAGVGLFTVALAEAVGATGSVVAVERDLGACADAEHNARDFDGVEVVSGDVTPASLQRLGDPPDLVVLDPARDGAGTDVARFLARWRPAPRLIAYVACDPATFARDLKVFLEERWTLASLRAFDLFPMTEHVELLAVLAPHGS